MFSSFAEDGRNNSYDNENDHYAAANLDSLLDNGDDDDDDADDNDDDNDNHKNEVDDDDSGNIIDSYNDDVEKRWLRIIPTAPVVFRWRSFSSL